MVARRGFGQTVSGVFGGRDIVKLQGLLLDFLPLPVIFYVHVLCSMNEWPDLEMAVGALLLSARIVNNSSLRLETNFFQERLDSYAISNCVELTDIFGFQSAFFLYGSSLRSLH